MFAFLGASANIAFVSALILMILIGIVHAIGLGGDFDADADLDMDGGAGLLSWLGVGRLPLLMLIVLFLGVFGIVGLVGQQLMFDLTGDLLTPWIAVPAAAAAALPLTGLGARGLSRIMPRDHTTAVPLEVLIGRSATIQIGRATAGSPARARAEDHYGQAHFIMVEPDNDGQAFVEGERVLIVRREGDIFRAISRGDHHVPRLEL